MVTLTDGAVNKVKDLLSETEASMGLRIFVKPGGCSGFSYGMALDVQKDSDRVLTNRGIQVLVDEDSAPYVEGSEVDYVEGLEGTGFKIYNPNAVSTCGCGSSFRTKDDAGVPGSCS